MAMRGAQGARGMEGAMGQSLSVGGLAGRTEPHGSAPMALPPPSALACQLRTLGSCLLLCCLLLCCLLADH